MNVLVFNADKEVGGSVYRACRNKGWKVYSIQDKPPVVGVEPILEGWYQTRSTELAYYSEILRCLDLVIRDELVFDHVIFGEPIAESEFSQEVELPWSLYRNSWGLAISKVLRQYKRLAPNGKVVHLLPTSGLQKSTLRILNQLMRVVTGMYDFPDILVTLTYPAIQVEVAELLARLDGQQTLVGTSWDLTGEHHG